MENKKLKYGYIFATIMIAVFIYDIYKDGFTGWHWKYDLVVIGILILIEFLSNWANRPSKPTIFIVLDIDNKPGLYDYPKHLPLPGIGDRILFDSYDTKGCCTGYVYMVTHNTHGSVTEIKIQVGDYQRIHEYQVEQLKASKE